MLSLEAHILSILFMGHRQTDQTPHYNVSDQNLHCLHNIVLKFGKNEKYHSTPIKLELGPCVKFYLSLHSELLKFLFGGFRNSECDHGDRVEILCNFFFQHFYAFMLF